MPRVAGKTLAWWTLPQQMKDLLQQKRIEGRFGGESAVAVGRARYFWGQEYGNEAANIQAKEIVHGPEGAFQRTLPAFREIAMEGMSGQS